jgi:succinyl-CoA synthetase beta subunit
MRLLEDELKPILKAHGVPVPAGGRYSPETTDELRSTGDRLVVKALSAHNDRYSRGEIEIVPADEVASAARRLSSAGPIWVEELVPHDAEYFLAVVWPGEADRPTALFSETGGSGVVDRAGAMRSVEVPPGEEPRSVAARLVQGHPELVGAAEALLAVFDELDALSLELNPVVVDAAGRPCVLDAKGYLDPYGRGPNLLAEGADEAEKPGEISVEYVELNGRIGLVSIGAGLTRAVIDWLGVAGPGAACFTDLIAPVLADASLLLSESIGPTCVAATRSITERLRARGVSALLVCLVSGGTPTDKLSQSVIEGLAGWGGPVVSFVAGNRSEAARGVWTDAGFASPPTLAEAIGAICAREAAGR